LFEKLIDIILNILSVFIGDATLEKLTDKMSQKKFRILLFSFFLFILAVIAICIYMFSITVTKVTISQKSLTMNVNDTQVLTATVLYSNNSTGNSVIWISSDESVATIDKNGKITALSSGTTIITAQASRNNSTESDECELIIKSPPSGYSISVHQTSIDSYAFVYITPYDADVTNIQIHGKSPSGKVFTPEKDKNNLYHFYAERGTWTIYASIENDAGTYEAHKPEDFVTIEVTNTTDILDGSLNALNNILQQLLP